MIVVTGATGTIGARVVARLKREGADVRAASRQPATDQVAFDFLTPATWDATFSGATSLFVLRPPALGNVRRDVVPALNRARQLGVRHVVILSVQGAERVPVLPHAALERWARGSGLAWTALRPAYFHQNLSGVLAPAVRRGELLLPAGRSRFTLVDADDVADVAAAVLLNPARFAGQGLTLTGEALTWDEIARVLSDALGRPIRYRNTGARGWLRHARHDLNMDIPMAVMTGIIHASARLGHSAQCTDEIEQILGRPPVTLRTFAEANRAIWR